MSRVQKSFSMLHLIGFWKNYNVKISSITTYRISHICNFGFTIALYSGNTKLTYYTQKKSLIPVVTIGTM